MTDATIDGIRAKPVIVADCIKAKPVIVADGKVCSRCRCSKPNGDFIGKNNRQVKTCLRCRTNCPKKSKEKSAEYARKFRVANPAYDKRDRKAYMKEYNQKVRDSKTQQKALIVLTEVLTEVTRIPVEAPIIQVV